MPTTTDDPPQRSRRDLLADELGAANVLVAADAYWQGWTHALGAARRALRSGPRVPTSDEAMRVWLDEPIATRLRFLCPPIDATEEEGPRA